MNPFQAQYPLSPRKFWKKFLPNAFSSTIASVVYGMMGAVVGVTLAILNDAAASSLGGMVTIGLLVFLVSFVLHIGWYWWYFKAYIRNYFYEGEGAFITIKKGVFAPREIHVQYAKIQDVYVDQDIVDRVDRKSVV